MAVEPTNPHLKKNQVMLLKFHHFLYKSESFKGSDFFVSPLTTKNQTWNLKIWHPLEGCLGFWDETHQLATGNVFPTCFDRWSEQNFRKPVMPSTTLVFQQQKTPSTLDMVYFRRPENEWWNSYGIPGIPYMGLIWVNNNKNGQLGTRQNKKNPRLHCQKHPAVFPLKLRSYCLLSH